jgi:hypothetical protein
MAKKSKKIEKETRKLIESIGDMVKRKNGRYKFKSKNKKIVKKVKKTCVHWIMRKGKEVPTVVHDPENPGMWRCAICGAKFPIKPLAPTEDGRSAYQVAANDMLGLVNQMQFWSVKLGGDAEDTKMFIKLKELLPRYAKVSKQILKRINKREEYENNRKRSDVMSQFDAYAGFNYRS